MSRHFINEKLLARQEFEYYCTSTSTSTYKMQQKNLDHNFLQFKDRRRRKSPSLDQ